jgi:hypothetical protein
MRHLQWSKRSNGAEKGRNYLPGGHHDEAGEV